MSHFDKPLHHAASHRRTMGPAAFRPCALLVSLLALCATGQAAPTRSTNIALTDGGSTLVNANFEADSVTLFQVRSGARPLRRLAEIPVGEEPVCVAVHPDGGPLFVVNGAGNTVSVIDLAERRVVRTIPVGTEPRGCALTPDGRRLFVANHTEGTVSLINTRRRRVARTIPLPLGVNPFAIAITDDGDSQGGDETVFVTQFYAELIPGGRGEGFNDGKRGVVFAFRVNDPLGALSKITLSPIDSGFTADRTRFCNATSNPPNPDPVNETFCPDPTGANLALIQNTPQAVFPNQFHAALIRGNRLFLPNIGAQPEPPVQFRTNVQALVHVVNTNNLVENIALHRNLNQQISTEPDPANPTQSLGKLFGNDIVAIDGNPSGNQLFIVSRGGNYVLRVQVQNGQLSIGAPNVVRIKTGNIPTGIVVAGNRAFVNNEVDHSVSVLDLASNTPLGPPIPSASLPAPGSHENAVLLGKLVFFTGLGVPDNGLVGASVRTIDPLLFRGKQSDNAWSTCASCHPAGLSDGVTWIFPDGPRNTLPLDALYSKVNGAHDTRINNWSAARDSVTDFNNNSRAVQGGRGFASDPPFSATAPNPAVFDHGISSGASEALDLETTWAQTVRPFDLPIPTAGNPDNGRAIFVANCASCHGGAKWTKSQVFFLNNPTLNRAAAAGGTPRDPGLTVTANQVVQYVDSRVDTKTLKFLEVVGTFNAASPIEIRGAGAAIGQIALGTLGFNVPSVLSTGFHAPYFHDGSAQTLNDVFLRHQLPTGGTISGLGGTADLLAFLTSLDGSTAIFESEADLFKDPFVNLP